MTDIWNEVSPAAYQALPPRVRDWVDLRTSMTAQVGIVGGGSVDVTVYRQSAGRLNTDEMKFFPSATDRPTVREVCLAVGGQPYLVARTSFTDNRLRIHPTIVKLGNKALGTLLFAEGPPRYTAREWALIGAGHPLFPLIRHVHSTLQPFYWGRRTLFELFGAPLLVTEIFLPELIHHQNVA